MLLQTGLDSLAIQRRAMSESQPPLAPPADVIVTAEARLAFVRAVTETPFQPDVIRAQIAAGNRVDPTIGMTPRQKLYHGAATDFLLRANFGNMDDMRARIIARGSPESPAPRK